MSSRMQRLERRDKMYSAIKVVLVVLAAAAVLGIGYRIGCQALIAINSWNQEIKVVEYGTMEDRLPAQAVVMNEEQIFLAREAGRFENLVKDKEKVGKGTLLGYFITNEGKSTLRAPQAGIFIRGTDGLEEVFTHIDLAAVTPEVFQYKPVPAFLDKPVQTGEPIFKIIDSLVPTRLLISLPEDKLEAAVQPGEKVDILYEGESWGQGRIKEMKQEAGDVMLLVELDHFSADTISKRFVKVEMVLDTHTGFLVPAEAIVEKDGEKGVYCAVGPATKFKPVEIIKQKDDTVLVRGLDKNDFIVTNPTARI
ncbi:MAG TPA: HlyD family efflux transporter periplasmic adaptor subunit [Syntrophomonadaceae bacterium]|nr:HlyD family efflux transporter periplasmic adaptor subunit [Syntrophomonadaceae bacterium]